MGAPEWPFEASGQPHEAFILHIGAFRQSHGASRRPLGASGWHFGASGWPLGASGWKFGRRGKEREKGERRKGDGSCRFVNFAMKKGRSMVSF